MAPFFETQSQAWVFLGMVYLGVALGLVYDVLGLVRKIGKKAPVFLADLLFFLLAGAALTLALVMTGQNSLRLYALLGLLCGGILYLLGLRRLLLGIAAFYTKRIGEPLKEAMARSREARDVRRAKKEAAKLKMAGRK
jgi:spore cortex biosynthesis protein YabQ